LGKAQGTFDTYGGNIKMTISAKIIKDSISEVGARITTLQLMYPRFIHAEMLTHRVFSRNASSSRAIPVKKMIEMVRNEPAMPIHWGANQPGMQASEQLVGERLGVAKNAWMMAAKAAADIAETMMEVGLHKQVANRILEPFQHIHVIVTATEWHNFFALRAHPDAQPEIQALAVAIREAMTASVPKLLHEGEWHLPYVTDEDFLVIEQCIGNPLNRNGVVEMAKKVSAARCARVSYLMHDGSKPSIEKDLELYGRLVGGEPIHASPVEHQATPDIPAKVFHGWEGWENPHLHGNFVGWIQYRKEIESSFAS
jgi:hypothetical protein